MENADYMVIDDSYHQDWTQLIHIWYTCTLPPTLFLSLFVHPLMMTTRYWLFLLMYYKTLMLLLPGAVCILPFTQWRHNEYDGVSNHQPYDCLLNRLFRRRSKKTSKLRVTGLCAGNSPVTDEFPSQTASNAENVSIWWRHHGLAKSMLQRELYGKRVTNGYATQLIYHVMVTWIVYLT